MFIRNTFWYQRQKFVLKILENYTVRIGAVLDAKKNFSYTLFYIKIYWAVKEKDLLSLYRL